MLLKIPFNQTIALIDEIPHNSITDTVILGHWTKHYEMPAAGQNGSYGKMKAQAVCWLYCWAMTGMNKANARIEAEFAFNKIFIRQFIQYPRHRNGEFHQWARNIRNSPPSANYENELARRLGLINPARLPTAPTVPELPKINIKKLLSNC